MRIKILKVLVAATTVFTLNSPVVLAAQITLSDLTIDSIAVDTTGQNKLIYVSPQQPQCYSLGQSIMLFNDVGENAKEAFSVILSAYMTGKKIEVIHDGTGYCKILRVRF